MLLLGPWMGQGHKYWCYCAVLLYLFIFSSGIVNRTWSQMCGRLYFPIFLLKVELFTLIYISSLMVLAKLFSSLLIILKFSIDVSWPLLFWCPAIGEGAFRCSLNIAPKVLPDSPIYSSITVNLPTTVAVNDTVLIGCQRYIRKISLWGL